MPDFIKRIILHFSTTDEITADYKDYSDFAYRASSLEKKRIIEDMINKANQTQRAIAESANRKHQHQD
jgi:hypothetical protein